MNIESTTMTNFPKPLVALTLLLGANMQAQVGSTLHLSHDATVQIKSPSTGMSGTGFFIADQIVVTCLHVVSRYQNTGPNNVSGDVLRDLTVTTATGEVIQADVASIPSSQDSSPLQFDFAILKLRKKPLSRIPKLEIAKTEELSSLDLGDDIIFSGFPLNTPGMVTHRGMIWGYTADKEIIFVQAPVNKGNSGGALLNKRGAVIGLVSMREGGITPELANIRNDVLRSKSSGINVQLAGVDTLKGTMLLVDTLDQYISVGIGYARNIVYARTYLQLHPILLK